MNEPNIAVKRILIIGSGGAGKSTLAIELGRLLQLEVIHLDAHFWHSGWRASTTDEWNVKVAQLIAGDRWVMDGNYSGTLDLRSSRADTIIFLNLNRWTCLWGIIRRRIHYHGQTRPELPEGCPERIDAEFFRYVWTYQKVRAPKILDRLKKYEEQGINVLIFTSREEIKTWLITLT